MLDGASFIETVETDWIEDRSETFKWAGEIKFKHRYGKVTVAYKNR